MSEAPEFSRASGLNDDAKCPARLATSAGEPDESHETADLGTGFHAVMQLRAEEPDGCDLVNPEVIPVLAEKYRVPVSGLQHLARNFTWTPHDLPNCTLMICEETLRHGSIKGHADLIVGWERKDGAKVLEVVDYKTGNPEFGVDASESLQVKWYACVAGIRFPNHDILRASINYSQAGDGGWSQHDFEEGEADELLRSAEIVVARSLDQFDRPPEERNYVKGEHCTFCAGRPRCPIYQREIRNILDNPEASIESENVCDLYQIASAMERSAKTVKELCQQHVRQHGSVESSDSSYIMEVRESTRPMFLTVELVEQSLGHLRTVVEDEAIENILQELRDRPHEPVVRCQPYKVKKRGKRDA